MNNNKNYIIKKHSINKKGNMIGGVACNTLSNQGDCHKHIYKCNWANETCNNKTGYIEHPLNKCASCLEDFELDILFKELVMLLILLADIVGCGAIFLTIYITIINVITPMTNNATRAHA